MYFSFNGMPEVKKLKLRERFILHKEVSQSLKLSTKYALVIILSFSIGITFAGVLASYDVKGVALGYSTMSVIFVLWMVSYLYILNSKVHPEVKRMVSDKQ